jgi:hypothetical protein
MSRNKRKYLILRKIADLFSLPISPIIADIKSKTDKTIIPTDPGKTGRALVAATIAVDTRATNEIITRIIFTIFAVLIKTA